jgi:hypothetical protein
VLAGCGKGSDRDDLWWRDHTHALITGHAPFSGWGARTVPPRRCCTEQHDDRDENSLRYRARRRSGTTLLAAGGRANRLITCWSRTTTRSAGWAARRSAGRSRIVRVRPPKRRSTSERRAAAPPPRQGSHFAISSADTLGADPAAQARSRTRRTSRNLRVLDAEWVDSGAIAPTGGILPLVALTHA